MVLPYIETPRSDAGNATYVIDTDLSVAEAFPSPAKDNHDLIKQIRSRSGLDLKTPRARAPFAERRNLPTKNEFTPLLKSATRNRLIQRDTEAKENGVPQTPAVFKPGYKSESPALPVDSSAVYGEDTGSSAGEDGDATPVPPAVSSSAMSTPIPVLPRKGEGVLNDGNLLTLREQEARLAQIDKENFGLKLKIHFLEDNLRKNGKDFNETAVRENTELKVDKLTLQRDLKQYRKSLAQAEKELQEYRQQLQDYAQKVKRRHADEGLQEELDRLRRIEEEKNSKIDTLQAKLRSADAQSEEANKLRDDIGDLEADLREKDRLLDDKEDEVQALQERLQAAQGDLEADCQAKEQRVTEYQARINVLEEELRSEKEKLASSLHDRERCVTIKDKELRTLEQRVQSAEANVESSSREQDRLVAEKNGEVRSMQTQVLTLEKRIEAQEREHERQINAQRLQTENKDELISALEEKLRSMEASLGVDLRKKNRSIEEKNYEIHALQQKLEAAEGRDVETEKLHDEIADLEADVREKEEALEAKEDELNSFKAQHQQAIQTHGCNLAAAQRQIAELERQQVDSIQRLQQLRQTDDQAAAQRDELLEELRERIRNLEEDNLDKAQHVQELQEDVDHLQDNVGCLQGVIKDKEAQFATHRDSWERQKRDLEAQKLKAEKQAAEIQRTVEKLQEAEGTLSGRELKLQEALESANQRHESEENQLRQEIAELSSQLSESRHTLENVRSQLALVKEELKASKSQQQALEDKVQGLEDEIDVLQTALDDESQQARQELDAARDECESLRRHLQSTNAELVEAQVAYTNAKMEVETSQENMQAVQAGTPKADLHHRIQNLTSQLSKLRHERQGLQDQLARATTAHADACADIDTLQLEKQTFEGSKGQLQQRLQDLQTQLSTLKREKQSLQDHLATANAEVNELRITVREANSAEDGARQEIAALTRQLQEKDHDVQRKMLAMSREHQAQILALEEAAQQYEVELSSLHSERDDLQTQYRQAEQTISRLSSKIHGLEQTLHEARAEGLDRTIAEERKDLHDLLKDAKLQAEDLALRVSERDARIEDLRAQLRRVREERRESVKEADAVASELQALKQRYDEKFDEMSRTKSLWEEEKRLLTQRANTLTTVTAKKDQEEVERGQRELQRMTREVQDKEKRHGAEIKGLVRQIQYLRARVGREERFRSGLCWQKRWFLMHVEMFGACNKADLHLLSKIGITPSPSQSFVHARPSLRTVVSLVIATVRMRRLSKEWSQKRKDHEGLVRKLEAMRGRRTTKAVRQCQHDY